MIDGEGGGASPLILPVPAVLGREDPGRCAKYEDSDSSWFRALGVRVGYAEPMPGVGVSNGVTLELKLVQLSRPTDTLKPSAARDS